MSKYPKVKSRFYARPGGKHFHTDLYCPMLSNGQYEAKGYKEITRKQSKAHRLTPCPCATKKEQERLIRRAENKKSINTQ